MKILFVSAYMVGACLAFTPLAGYGADIVQDPVQDYVKWIRGPHKDDMYSFFPQKRMKPTTLAKVVADIDGDGKQEVLLSLYGLENGQEGLLWSVYTPVEGGYRNMGEVIFHPKAFDVGYFEGYGWGIVKYLHGSINTGMLIFTQLKNGNAENTPIREISLDNPEDEKFYENLVGNVQQPQVEDIPLSNFPEPKAPEEPAAPPATEPQSKTDTNVLQPPAKTEPSPTAAPSVTPLSVPPKPSPVATPPTTAPHPSWTRLSIALLGALLAIIVIVALLLFLRRQRSKHEQIRGDHT